MKKLLIVLLLALMPMVAGAGPYSLLPGGPTTGDEIVVERAGKFYKFDPSTFSVTANHDELGNLDYASSGHTGFQPAGSYLTSESDPIWGATTYSDIVDKWTACSGYLKSDGTCDIPAGGGAVDSVNSQTGDVVLDPDDLDDTSTTNKFTTAGDISKLAGIESGATADQSDAEIKTAYENNADTNALTDSEKTLLDAAEATTSNKLYFIKNGALQEATIAARVKADLSEAPLTTYMVSGYSVANDCTNTEIYTPAPDAAASASLTVWGNAVTAAGGNPDVNVAWRCLVKPDTVLGTKGYIASYATAGGITTEGTASMLGQAAQVAVYGTTGNIVAVGDAAMLGQAAQVASYGTTGLISVAGIVDMLGQAAQIPVYGTGGDITSTSGGPETTPVTINALESVVEQNSSAPHTGVDTWLDSSRNATSGTTLNPSGTTVMNIAAAHNDVEGEWKATARAMINITTPAFTGTAQSFEIDYTVANQLVPFDAYAGTAPTLRWVVNANKGTPITLSDFDETTVLTGATATGSGTTGVRTVSIPLTSSGVQPSTTYTITIYEDSRDYAGIDIADGITFSAQITDSSVSIDIVSQ